MKTRILTSPFFLAFVATGVFVIFFAAEAAGQESLNSATIVGRLHVVNTNATSDAVRASARAGTIAYQVGGTNVVVPVELNAYNCEYNGPFGVRTNDSVSLVEFEIRSSSSTQFSWSCLAWASEYPHDFAVFTTTNNETYAVYVSSASVNMFLVSSPVSSEAALRLFLDQETGPGAVRGLYSHVFTSAGVKYFGMNALHWTMSVDSVAVLAGELRVTLHGEEPMPQFIYVLRNGEWMLLHD